MIVDRKLVLTAAIAALVAGGMGLIVGRGTSSESKTTQVAEDIAGGSDDAKTGEQAAAADELRLDDVQTKAAGIVVAAAGADVLGSEIVAPGTVTSSPQGAAVLTARVAGSVSAIDKRLGDPVSRGDRLAVIESREAAGLAADRESAGARLRLAQATYAREQGLFAAKVTARADLETAQAALEQARAEVTRTAVAISATGVSANGRGIAVRSPIAGRVTSAPAVLGSYVNAETELFRVTDPRQLQIEVAVPVADARRIAQGDTARIEIAGVSVSAIVRAVTPALDPATRTATVVLAPVGPVGDMRPGAFVQARIRSRATGGASTIVIPAEALQSVGGRDAVFVRDRGRFKVRPVVVGERAGDRVQLLAGLEAGERIGTTNAFLLKAELEKPREEEGE